MYRSVQTDVLIIGSEGAGARAAIAAAETGAQVAVVTKGRLGRSGATVMAAADISVDSRSISQMLHLTGGDTADSPETFLEDILKAGKGINNRPLAQAVVSSAPQRVAELLEWGLKVAHVIHAPGHRYPRGVGTTGREIVRVLKKQLKRSTIRIMEHVVIVDLITAGGGVCGAVGLDLVRGDFVVIQARATVLATGGGAMSYPLLTGARELTGDGYALALRAGARLVDMEMIQFMPLCLLDPPAYQGSLLPFLMVSDSKNSLDGRLLNRQGQRFMQRWDPENLERSTRDVLAAAIGSEIYQGRGSPGGGVYLSLAHLPMEIVADFARWALKPMLTVDWRFEGLDYRFLRDRLMAGKALEVGPACHFFVGGIDVDPQCRTSAQGLFAAGEVVGGLHGANRLSGNACMEMLVEGEIAGRRAGEYALQSDRLQVPRDQAESLVRQALSPLEAVEGAAPYGLRRSLRSLAWQSVGVVRHADALDRGVEDLKRLRRDANPSACRSKQRLYNREWLCALENRNLIDLADVVVRSARVREESRGVHVRADWPEQRRQWQCNLTAAAGSDGITPGAVQIERRAVID